MDDEGLKRLAQIDVPLFLGRYDSVQDIRENCHAIDAEISDHWVKQHLNPKAVVELDTGFEESKLRFLQKIGVPIYFTTVFNHILNILAHAFLSRDDAPDFSSVGEWDRLPKERIRPCLIALLAAYSRIVSIIPQVFVDQVPTLKQAIQAVMEKYRITQEEVSLFRPETSDGEDFQNILHTDVEVCKGHIFDEVREVLARNPADFDF